MEIYKIKITHSDRKLVSDFMGEQFPEEIDFNWLMPVWKKVIEVIGLWCNTNGKEKVWHEANDNIRHHMFCEVDVEKTCKEISYLIQWYNKTKL